MITGIDWAGDLFLALFGVSCFIVGWIGGMLHMRNNYLSLLRADRIEKRRMGRMAEQRAKQERLMGYVVGYREGSRAFPNGMERAK